MTPPAVPLSTAPVAVPHATPQLPAGERERLVARAKLFAWVGVGWHGVEAAIAILAGLAAGSIALIGFGADSLIEAAAGFALLWRFAASRANSDQAERRAQQLIAVSFYVLAAYVGVESVRTLALANHPDVSWVGIGLSLVTLATMPPLAIAKARIGEQLGSSATRSESRQTMVCAMLSAALLVGLGLNAAFGLWWADPATALVVAGVALNEGRNAWRGEGCCVSVPADGVTTIAACCDDDCCSER
jgi:divalent metal cation (Fe/Co/Zn/Cd) transporter